MGKYDWRVVDFDFPNETPAVFQQMRERLGDNAKVFLTWVAEDVAAAKKDFSWFKPGMVRSIELTDANVAGLKKNVQQAKAKGLICLYQPNVVPEAPSNYDITYPVICRDKKEDCDAYDDGYCIGCEDQESCPRRMPHTEICIYG